MIPSKINTSIPGIKKLLKIDPFSISRDKCRLSPEGSFISLYPPYKAISVWINRKNTKK
jgi:hypothetical protein